MNSFEQLFARIAEEVEVVDKQTFRHVELGEFKQSEYANENINSRGDLRAPQDLWRLIYLHYHAGDEKGVEKLRQSFRETSTLFQKEDGDFVALLENANVGRGYLSSNWRLTNTSGESCKVQKDQLTLRVRRHEMRGQELRIGDVVSVRFPKAMRYAYPGCYMAISDKGTCEASSEQLIRLYYNVGHVNGAVQLMRELTTLLNSNGWRFQLKVMNNPRMLHRRDSLVLYLPGSVWKVATDALAALHVRCAKYLQGDVPCFTLPLGWGWSFAEEPTGTERLVSFGQHRAQLTADGLFTAFSKGLGTANEKLQQIEQRFTNAGLELAHPYKNPAISLLLPAAGEGAALLRRLPGPFEVRSCFASVNGVIWSTQLHQPLASDVASAVCRVDSTITDPTRSVNVCLPSVIDPHMVVYQSVAGAALLFDSVFGGRASAHLLATVFERLGGFLASLHAMTGDGMPTTHGTTVPRYISVTCRAENNVAGELPDACLHLPRNVAPSLRAWAETDHVAALTDGCLIHGRFSIGSIAWDSKLPDAIRVMDWLEVGKGDPYIDLAQPVSELAEGVAGGFIACDEARMYAQSLIFAATRTLNIARLRGRVARAIINHQNLHAWTTKQTSQLSLFLPAAEAAVLRLTEALHQ